MNNNYIFTVDHLSTLNTNGHEDYVVSLSYSISLTEDNHTGIFRGFKEFEVKDVENFTPFKDLTEAVVTEWIKSSLTEEEITFIDTRIQDEINSSKNPVVTPQMKTAPWVKGRRPF